MRLNKTEVAFGLASVSPRSSERLEKGLGKDPGSHWGFSNSSKDDIRSL